MPEGRPFRLTERSQQLRELARQLMEQHGLSDWEFGLNSNVRRAGVCHYPHGCNRGRIELSAYFAERNSEAEIRDTLLHEIAHALVGPDQAHNAVWRAKCVEIGARPERCYGESVKMPRHLPILPDRIRSPPRTPIGARLVLSPLRSRPWRAYLAET
jgi:hypothetical protein